MPDFARAPGEAPAEETLDEIIARRVAFLTDYQDEAWARRYRATIERVREAERPHGSEALTEAAARALFKLMAYKDEYEVARLHMESGFLDELRENFEGDYKVQLSPRAAVPRGRQGRARPAPEAAVRPLDPDADAAARAHEAPARRAFRRVRLHGGTARGARADRLVRGVARDFDCSASRREQPRALLAHRRGADGNPRATGR